MSTKLNYKGVVHILHNKQGARRAGEGVVILTINITSVKLVTRGLIR